MDFLLNINLFHIKLVCHKLYIILAKKASLWANSGRQRDKKLIQVNYQSCYDTIGELIVQHHHQTSYCIIK
jgi:hypothetical protein